MPIRQETLRQLHEDINNQGTIEVSRRGRTRANKTHEGNTRRVEDSRREVLYYDLATHYRVAIFGSHKFDEDSKEFRFVRDLACALVEARKVDIVTGGGPGIMKAAPFGAHVAIEQARANGRRLNSRTHGEIIAQLNTGEVPNGYTDLTTTHSDFGPRIQQLIDKTQAAYNAPGGLGTLSEQVLLALAKQVGHLEGQYLIIAHPFWKPFVDKWNDEFYHNRLADDLIPLINAADLELIRFTDSIPEIVDMVSQSYDRWMAEIRSHVRLTR